MNESEVPEFFIGEMKIKNDNTIKVNDMKNVYITEELIMGPMYEPIIIDNTLPTYKFFPYSDFRLELYCNNCRYRRMFSFQDSKLAHIPIGIGSTSNTVKSALKKVDYFTFKALADCSHELVIVFKVVDENTVMKVGQFPSIYDMNESINSKDFLRELDKTDQDYYKKACASFCDGFCIGAITYLRRIFEKVLIDTFNENFDKLSITVDEFKKQRMEDKINTLKIFLPDTMYEQGFSSIYSKISNGIHNLNETECKDIFPILKSGLEEILLERMERKNKAKRKSELSKKLQDI
jgi:hypothetical protein